MSDINFTQNWIIREDSNGDLHVIDKRDGSIAGKFTEDGLETQEHHTGNLSVSEDIETESDTRVIIPKDQYIQIEDENGGLLLVRGSDRDGATVESAEVNPITATIGPDRRQWGDRVDVFAIGGQSNAVGQGDSSQSPDVPSPAAQYYRGGELQPMSDPLGPSDTGSAWPMFALRYHQLTGNHAVFVEHAENGSAMADGAAVNHGSWDSGGNHRQTLVNRVGDCLSHLTSQGYDPHFKGVLWMQGERDAQAIDTGDITVSDYQTAIRGMMDFFGGEFPSPWFFGVFETGTNASGDTGGFRAIRRSQRELCRDMAYPQATYLSGIQRDFPDMGLMNPNADKADLHFNQEGYNRMGREGAENLVSGDVKPTASGCSVSLSANQSNTNDDQNRIIFDQQDTGGSYQFDGDRSAIRIEESGEYLVSGAVLWDGTIPDNISTALYITVNGTNEAGGWASTGGEKFTSTPSTPRRLSLESGDLIRAVASKNTNTSVDMFGADNGQWTHLSVTPAGQ